MSVHGCAKEKIMKRILLLLLAGCLLTILGCAGAQVKTDNSAGEKKQQIAGTYYNPFSEDIYLELKEDGTLFDKFGTRTANGKYVVKNNHVIFTLDTGRTFECTFDGKSLITKEGIKYSRH